LERAEPGKRTKRKERMERYVRRESTVKGKRGDPFWLERERPVPFPCPGKVKRAPDLGEGSASRRLIATTL